MHLGVQVHAITQQALAHFSDGQVKLVSVANQTSGSTPAQFEISVQLQ